MTDDHVAACFIRVDVRVHGAAATDTYDALSERLQDLLQEAVLVPSDDGEAIDLRGMTCLVLGPIPDDESMENLLDYEEHFAPVAEWLTTQEPEQDAADRLTDPMRSEVFEELQHVIAEEIDAQLGVERSVEAMPPLIADTVLDHFDVAVKPCAGPREAG